MGRIGAPHGVRGAVKVTPFCADPESLLAQAEWWLRSAGGWSPRRLRSGRERAGVVVAELEGVRSRDEALALRGAEVGVPRERLPGLAAGEHYQADLVGMAVVNRNGEKLGEVAGFMESGAHPIVRVAGPGGAERLIPWVAPYIDRVDASARRIDVDWPAGF